MHRGRAASLRTCLARQAVQARDERCLDVARSGIWIGKRYVERSRSVLDVFVVMLKMDRIIHCQAVCQRLCTPLQILYFKTLNLDRMAGFNWL